MAQKSGQARDETDHDLVVKDFLGVNTQAARTAIAENEFAWLENVFPIGYANLKAIPYQGSPVATIAGVSITYMKYVNITNTDYLICFTLGGSGHALNLTTYAVTLIGAAGTFTGSPDTAQWKNERTLIIATNGYWSWDPVGGLVSLGGVTGAPATGATISTYSGRVWIGLNRTESFSSPNSYQDFTVASSGGSFIITDETLTSNIVFTIPANNFLYIFGTSSINVISDVRIGVGTPAPTLFSNTNISSQIGSAFPGSIFVSNRSIAFVTPYGFYSLYGTNPQKISDHLDGIMPLIDFTRTVSGGIANIYSSLGICFQFTYKDPSLGPRPLFAIYINKKWFFASQGNAISVVSSVFQGSVPNLFGTDGTNIWKLFSDTNTNINSKIITALWPLKATTRMKEAQKIGVEIAANSPATQTSLSVVIDSDFGTIFSSINFSNNVTWINNSMVVVPWVNNLLQPVTWTGNGFLIYQGDCESKGRYIGYTITSTAPGYSINGLLMQYQVSTPWATSAS